MGIVAKRVKEAAFLSSFFETAFEEASFMRQGK
jgi:hypothetical protein